MRVEYACQAVCGANTLKKPTTVRFDPKIEEALQKQAKIENRTVSNLIETAVRVMLEKNGYLATTEG
jgi:hypothetical protein